MYIDVLALQGGVAEHIDHIKQIGRSPIEIKSPQALKDIHCLIIPGGESTTISKLLNYRNSSDPLKEYIEKGLPVWGTCAGMMLLAKEFEDYETPHLGLMDIKVKRNAYGRQSGSFETQQIIEEVDENDPVHMVFIRAPYISDVLNINVKILCTVNGEIAASKQKNMIVISFHPELTDDLKFLKYFITHFC